MCQNVNLFLKIAAPNANWGSAYKIFLAYYNIRNNNSIFKFIVYFSHYQSSFHFYRKKDLWDTG